MELNKYIDVTLLKGDATKRDILNLCNEALENDYASVCVNPYYVSYAKEILSSSSIAVCTVVGFPLGAEKTEVKILETKLAIEDGADEIDMVMNIGAFKDQKYDFVKQEMIRILEACEGRILKVILETGLLSSDEIKMATQLCNEAHVHFIKTSTGFGVKGATIEDVRLIMDVKSDLLEVKASGGIQTFEQVSEYIDLGVTRIGTSHAKEIMEEWK